VIGSRGIGVHVRGVLRIPPIAQEDARWMGHPD
jgi:hypothetical protein